MNETKSVLILEDDAALLDFLAEIFVLNGFSVIRADTCARALFAIENEAFDCAVLDVLLPDGSGLDVLRSIRGARGNVPVVMQTALADDEYCVRCLKSGADDFVVKPVRAGPLLARVEAVMRRAAGTPPTVSRTELRGGAAFDWAAFRLFAADGSSVPLTRNEAKLLRALADRPGEFVPAESIVWKVWGEAPSEASASRLASLISRLRGKLGGAAELESRYGEGYALKI